MITQQQMNAIAGMIGIKADVFAQALSDEQEVKLELPENGKFYTDEKIELIKDNHGKRKYDEGKSKRDKELFEGKTFEEFKTDFKKSILDEAQIEPNEKLTKLQGRFDTLQEKYKTDIASKDEQLLSLTKEKESILNDSVIKQNMPKLKEGFTVADGLTIYKANHEKKEDGIYRNGKLLTDDSLTPLSQEDAISTFFTEKGWIHEEIKGHGGKRPKAFSSEPKTYDEFKEYCESKKWNEGSLEAKSYLAKIKAKNPDFDHN